MQRIYLPNTDFQNRLLITDRELYHQITRVMRARVGQRYAFFDGKNREDFLYEIIEINKSECHFHLVEIQKKSSESCVLMCLYQGVPNKFSKIETIVQKSCELGYNKIIFFQAVNSQKLIVSENKKERLIKIAVEAVEQCGGNIIPEISFDGEIDAVSGNTLVCHTQGVGSKSLIDIELGEEVNVVVGPEGGLHEDEINKLEKLGAQKVFFGNRILRCETVAPLIGFYISQKKES